MEKLLINIRTSNDQEKYLNTFNNLIRRDTKYLLQFLEIANWDRVIDPTSLFIVASYGIVHFKTLITHVSFKNYITPMFLARAATKNTEVAIYIRDNMKDQLNGPVAQYVAYAANGCPATDSDSDKE